jgi:hypothetical protein
MAAPLYHADPCETAAPMAAPDTAPTTKPVFWHWFILQHPPRNTASATIAAFLITNNLQFVFRPKDGLSVQNRTVLIPIYLRQVDNRRFNNIFPAFPERMCGPRVVRNRDPD